MWLIRTFWGLCGVFAEDLSHNKSQYVYSVLLLITCAYNFLTASSAVCRMDHWCVIFSSTVLEIYDRVLASTIFFSRCAILYRGHRDTMRYKTSVDAFEKYAPTPATELGTCRRFSVIVVAVCLALAVPINVGRLCSLFANDASVQQLLYHLFLNVQNLSMCCVETQFVTQCFAVYVKFRGVNDDLRTLNDVYANHSRSLRHPFGKGFYAPRSLAASRPVAAHAVEVLRIRHWLTRQSADTLNDMFGVHMGLSVFYLWMVTLFDIYYEIFDKNPSKTLVYGWLLQYSLRLLMIILVAHYTTKQALRSKSLITDINSIILDDSTKEELQLFLNQIHCSSTEFTAYDFFSLNTQIIKSVVAAAATYLVILVQLRSF